MTLNQILGASVKRHEDPRLISGKGRYTDDVQRPGLTYAAFLRSPYAHARLASIDTEKARTAPGVVLVVTGFDVPLSTDTVSTQAGVTDRTRGADVQQVVPKTGGAKINQLIPTAWLPPNSDLKVVPHPALAREKVRYVGDAVAIVVADTRNHAGDAVDLINVDYEVLPATVTAENALEPAAPEHEGAIVVQLQAEYSFPVPPPDLWGLLLNTESLRNCIPGCQSLEVTGLDQWSVTLAIGVAAIKGTYTGKIAIIDKQEPTGYTLQVDGNGKPGWVKGNARVTLSADGSGTRLTVNADGQVGGMIAGVGQRMLTPAARTLMNQFFECLKNRADMLCTARICTKKGCFMISQGRTTGAGPAMERLREAQTLLTAAIQHSREEALDPAWRDQLLGLRLRLEKTSVAVISRASWTSWNNQTPGSWGERLWLRQHTEEHGLPSARQIARPFAGERNNAAAGAAMVERNSGSAARPVQWPHASHTWPVPAAGPKPCREPHGEKRNPRPSDAKPLTSIKFVDDWMTATMASLQGVKVAILVENGFEQLEMTEPRRVLDQAGASTSIVSPKSQGVRGWNFTDWGQEFVVDVQLDQADAASFDALLLPGGVMNPDMLRTQPPASRLCKPSSTRTSRWRSFATGPGQ